MRLFIAVKLSKEVQKAAVEIQDQFQKLYADGRFSPQENLHLTLAFIGEYPDPDEVLEILEPLEFAPFQITMDKVGCFDDLWWTGFAKSKELENLAGQVRHLLSDADIPYDKKKFRPHVTLLRNARYYSGKPPYLEIRPVSMMVDHFCLMRSTRGKHGMIYTELGSVAASQSK